MSDVCQCTWVRLLCMQRPSALAFNQRVTIGPWQTCAEKHGKCLTACMIMVTLA